MKTEKSSQPDCTHTRVPKDGIYRVYSDVKYVVNFLTHPKFELVDNREDADILWLMENFKDFAYVKCIYHLFYNALTGTIA